MQKPGDDRGVNQDERAEAEHEADADVREERAQEEDQCRTADPSPVERALQTLRHSGLR